MLVSKCSRKVLEVSFLLALGVGCSAAQKNRKILDEKYGSEEVREREVLAEVRGKLDYEDEVRPILENRCVLCHGCYDAPCQLKLGAPEGIDRGGSKDVVYDGTRLLATKLTRLFDDASSTKEWRNLGFHPVLNERSDSEEANREGSVLHQMLALKKKHPLKAQRSLEGFEFALDRELVCPTIEEFPKYEKEHPSWGMPYALPALSEEEESTLRRWIEEGATHEKRPPLGEEVRRNIHKWEALFNQEGNKERLISRYLFEHLFQASLHFTEETGADTEGGGGAATTDSRPRYFRLVRSSTAPGKPLKLIATRRPFDDPSVERVYYRFDSIKTPVLAKTHMPYALHEARRKRWQALFFDRSFQVKDPAVYHPKWSANPFYTFNEIPINSRYRFLLDEARFFLDGFIKGPVCRGQTALNVIQDRFWVAFGSPETTAGAADAAFYAKEIPQLDLPAGQESNARVSVWFSYAEKEKKFLRARAAYLNQHYGKPAKVKLDLLWDGDGTNKNAALTVFRHEDSATVVQGFIGTPPKTTWLMGYGLFERIHYLLVAGFDVYGNVGHQLISRLYMDFLRMEGESTFLAFLPRKSRESILNSWYQGVEDEAHEFINGKHSTFLGETGLSYSSRNPQLEFYDMLQGYLKPVLARELQPSAMESLIMSKPVAALIEMSEKFSTLRGGAVTYLPQVSFFKVRGQSDAAGYYTLLRDNDHANILSLLSEEDNRRPERDRFTLVRGLVGAYPNAFFEIPEEDLKKFEEELSSLASEEDYLRLRDRYGIRRSSPKFWTFSDQMHQSVRSDSPLKARLFDFNRLENR